MGGFTGAFKEQEWEQSWGNMLILWAGSFYHWQVTLWGNKARKWLGVFELSQSRWYFCSFLRCLFESIYDVLFFCAVIKSSVQISYHPEELELSSVRLGEGITFNCNIFLHFGLFSAISEKNEKNNETWQVYCYIVFQSYLPLPVFSPIICIWDEANLY